MASYSYAFSLTDADAAHHGPLHQLMEAHKHYFEQFAKDQQELKRRAEALERENSELKQQQAKLQAALVAQPVSDVGAHPSAASSQVLEDGSGPLHFIRSFKIHDAPVHSVTMGKGSDVVGTASWDARCKLYNLKSGQVVKTLGDPDGKMSGLYCVAFAKTSDDIIACSSCDGNVYVWNHETSSLGTTLSGHSDEVNSLDFHAHQQVLATASDDCKCIIWDWQEGMQLRSLETHFKAVYGCTFFGPENEFLVATTCFDQNTRVFDMRDRSVVAMLKLHTDDIIGISYCSSKRLLATGADDGTIGMWDIRNWKMVSKIETKEASKGENEVKRVAFSHNGAWLAAGCSSGQVLVYDVDSTRSVSVLDGHTDCCFDVAWGTDPVSNDTMLVSASHDHTSRFWSTRAAPL
jgi:WD40 repeat protein